MANVFYTTEKKCVVCDKPFTVTRVKSRLTMTRQDSDFCTAYKEVNPYYYGVWVCPNCGYAALDAYFDEVPSALPHIRKFLESRQVGVDFGGTRTREQAITTYKLALFFAEMAGAPASRMGGLLLKWAWLLREAGETDEELQLLDKARQQYEQAFLREKMPVGNLTELALEYLIGELFFRTGRLTESLSYFGKVMGNPQLKKERRIHEMAKDAWAKAREAKKAALEAERAESLKNPKK